jgi:DNA mismatch repair protein MutL
MVVRKLMHIQVLPQTLINQIAAGEVAVNMASVVKELVENALDADAKQIEIALSDNMLDMEISDDGIGMDRDDAELALQRHATSKIRSSEDLVQLMTRGFRGEAIPSIASVSRMEILTRPRDAVAGTRVQVEGGSIERIESVGCPAGTRIRVHDLFYNTPARRKFLKSPTSEWNAVVQTVVRQALAAPDVGFLVSKGGQAGVQFPPGQDFSARFADLLGSRLSGDLVSFFHQRGECSVSGVIAPPTEASRGDRRYEYLFVNGRPFSSKSITAAIEQACRGFLLTGRFPMFAIFITVPPTDVDINVHPTKEEVRFRDERHVAGTCHHAVRNALEATTVVPSVAVDSYVPPAPVTTQAFTAASPEAGAPPMPAFFSSPEALVRRAFEGKQRREQQADWVGVAMDAESEKSPSKDAVELEPDGPARERLKPVAAGPGEKPESEFWNRPYLPEPLGQVALTYIVAVYGDDLLVIDQHAAHERLKYLEFAESLGKGGEVQTLLVPPTIEIGASQAALLEKLVPTLAELGFEVEAFGGRSYMIRTVPADLVRINPEAILTDLLDDMEENRGRASLDDLRDRLVIRAACHGSIRGGQALSIEEMSELLRLMRVHRLSFTCPHGRPTIIRLSRHDLDRRFGRLH